MKIRKKLLESLTGVFKEHAIHLWIIFSLASVTLAYSISFYIRASQNTYVSSAGSDSSSEPDLIAQNTDLEDEPSPTIAPLGPIISLSFTVPGIGTSGGNLRPRHATRDVTFFLYPQDVNATANSVKPTHIIQGKAHFDQDFESPTYGQYINQKIDLGSAVKDGMYQISFKTNQSFRTLIKDSSDSLQGKLFRLEKGVDVETNSFATQAVIIGDISPIDGNNIVDIDDYRAFVNCFEGRSTNPRWCPYPNLADFNDDGVTDSIDYNLLLLSYRQLVAMGVPVPTIYLDPKGCEVSRISYLEGECEKPTQKPIPTIKSSGSAKAAPSPTPAPQTGSSGAVVGSLLLLLLLGGGGGAGFFLYKKKMRPGTPPAASGDAASAVESAKPAETSAAQQTSGQIEQEYYVKNQGPDETKTGFWLDLTGDKGHEVGHYKGAEVKEGFAQVKGVVKTENGKTFLEISEITAEN